jgi:hypothetical protein
VLASPFDPIIKKYEKVFVKAYGALTGVSYNKSEKG